MIAKNDPAPAVTPKKLLADYLADVHSVRQWRAGVTAHELHLHTIACRWFDAFLKRPPTLADLSKLTLSAKQSTALIQFIVNQGRKPGVARSFVERLYSIWRGIVWSGQLPSNGRRPRLAIAGRIRKSQGPARHDSIPTSERVEREKTLPKKPDRKSSAVKATSNTTLADLLAVHYAVARSISALTIKSTYASAIRSFAHFLETVPRVKDLTDANLNAWIAWGESRRALHTVHGWRQVLLCLWRFAYEESIVDRLPRKVRKVKRPPLIPEGWDSEQVGKLLAAADAVEGVFRRSGVEKRLWWRAFILCSWYTGLRLSDVLALKAASIARMPDGTGRLTVRMQKTGETTHRVFPRDAMQAIDAVMASGDCRELILPTWVNRRLLYREIKLLIKAAGLTGSAKYLRRGSASEAERIRPGAGSLHLGHRSPELFNKNYRVDRIVKSEITLPPSPVPVSPAGKAGPRRKAVAR